MTLALLIAAYLAISYRCIRPIRVWEFRNFEREFPSLYANPADRQKEWDECGWAVCCAAIWPIGLPLAAVLTGRVRWVRSTPPPPPAKKANP